MGHDVRLIGEIQRVGAASQQRWEVFWNDGLVHSLALLLDGIAWSFLTKTE